MDAFLASFLLRLSLSVWLPVVAPAPAPALLDVELSEEAFGRSGALRAAFVLPGEAVPFDVRWPETRPADAWYRWIPTEGDPTPSRPFGGTDPLVAPDRAGTWTLEVGSTASTRAFDDLTLFVLVPASEQRGGLLYGYRIGEYPSANGRYAPPQAYIRVTPETQHIQISEHFRLREFLTHDQANVWPKFAVVDPLLLDKLELVMDELESSGVPARHMIVMSGFRTPQYNRKGLSQGRAELSRHQYGDAADVWVDNDGDWYIDDLNRDGRKNLRDARVLLEAVERVERAHPELIGGAGLYDDNGAHGPFVHIDVRGRRARW